LSEFIFLMCAYVHAFLKKIILQLLGLKSPIYVILTLHITTKLV